MLSSVATPPSAPPVRASPGSLGGVIGPQPELARDTGAATGFELSETFRTPADSIDVHMRRREMTGLSAAPPKLTTLERACGRSLKAVHQLCLGAALFIQMHVRCLLALKRGTYSTHRRIDWHSNLPPRYAAALIGTGDAAAAAQLRLTPVQKRLLREWRWRLDPTRVVKNTDGFLAPIILMRRREAATMVQAGFRRHRAMLWKSQAVAARRVQREWRKHVVRSRVVRVRQQAVDLTRRQKSAHAMLDEELAILELKCQPPAEGATAPALRVLSLVRGRVLDSCSERIRQLLTREVERVTPHALTRDEVKALLQSATMGLFPEAEEEEALLALGGGEEMSGAEGGESAQMPSLT